MNTDIIIGLCIGLIVGWLTKVPFLIKWYRELKITKDYKDVMQKERFERFKESFGSEAYENYLKKTEQQ